MMQRRTRNSVSAGLALLLAVLWSGTATGGVHTWDVVEVFSNADATIQYVELMETGGGATETGVGNLTITSNTQSHAIANGAVAGPTSFKSYLIATPAFAALSGAPVPDEVLPASAVPFFAAAGDSIGITVDTWAFTGAPTNGTDALNRTGGTVTNSPTNYAGVTGTVNAAPPPSVPLSSWPAVALLLAAVAASGTGAAALRASSRQT